MTRLEKITMNLEDEIARLAIKHKDILLQVLEYLNEDDGDK